ncbi:MAG: condensation domain-containing protein, partial [Pyrinomonadaceae bacterium]
MSQQIIEGYQLSPQQKHLWSLSESGKHRPYTAQCTILMEGPLDREVLRTALDDLIERHEILRTTFNVLADMTIPLQVVKARRELSIDECDFSDLSGKTQEDRIDALVGEVKRLQRNLDHGTQLRFMDVLLARQKRVLLISMPSLYADTLALKILMQDLGDCYAACLQGGEQRGEAIQYADLSDWQNESLQADGSEIGKDYWRKQQLPGTFLNLPFERDFPKEVEFSPESRLSLVVKHETVAKLERLSGEHQSVVSTSLLAAFFIVLGRLSAAQ